MYIATFGPKGFMVSAEKLITFRDFQLSSTLETEKQENTGKKPSTYIKNQGLSSLSLKVKVDHSLGLSPSGQIEAWMKVLAEGKPYPFILNGKPLLKTKFLLVDVSLSDTLMDNRGNILSVDISLKFDEFSRQGSKKENSSKSKKEKKSTESVYEALKPREKQQLKVTTQEQAMKLVRK